MARVADHLTCVGASAMELGAFTAFLYMLKARDRIFDLLEEVSGARLTHSYVRIGGVAEDLPEGYPERCRDAFQLVRRALADCDKLLTRNRIFLDRMQGVGRISSAEAISYGYTGPCLRSTGIAYDVRKDHPYLVYDRLAFEVPVGENGDNMDRYLVRMEEIEQSLRLCEQALSGMPPGDVMVDDPRVALPPKAATYNTIESMINHFKLIVDGIKVPPGEVYSYTEGGNGELGFYIVSDGTGRPYKCRCRPPCFTLVQSLPRLIEGAMIADVVPTFGSLNMIGGECDR
jgi:NADH-quinone oxidoreductase subunit D